MSIDPRNLIQMCRSCSASIYGSRPPTPEYAERVARLLAGTCAVESALKYHRQAGFSYGQDSGAWGLWQTEWPAVLDSVQYLRKREDVRANAIRWIYGEQGDWWGALLSARPVDLVRVCAVWPRFACAFARLHYIRFPEPVPADLGGQADYWKRLYNTRLGAGTRDRYVSEYLRLIAPALG